MAINDAQRTDMNLRAFVKSLCAPIWWEQRRQTVVNSGSMCVLKTPEALIGITNNHVLKIYEKHKAKRDDIFCQLGSAPFDPTANLIACSEYWDLATLRYPCAYASALGPSSIRALVVAAGGYHDGGPLCLRRLS